jgi:erythromycin esterase-like protein
MDKEIQLELKGLGVNSSNELASSGKTNASRLFLLVTICVAITSIVLAVYYGINSHNCQANDSDDTAFLDPVDWIKQNAYNITSIETTTNDDFSDLTFLSDILKDVDILWIGEANHGDGTVHVMRTRIIKYLHKCCGFNTLAFEVPLFDGLNAYSGIVNLNETTRTDENVAEIFKANLPPYWGNVEETQELFQYVAEMAPTNTPLEFTGYVS